MMRARRSKIKRPRSSSQPLRGGLVDRASRSKIPRMAESGDEIESRLPASISRFWIKSSCMRGHHKNCMAGVPLEIVQKSRSRF